MAKKQNTKVEFADSAHKVWLAGLGALATAGAEGEKLFDALVQRGEKLEKQVNLPVGQASARVLETVEQARARASDTLDSISNTIDDTVALALRRLGVPTKAEIKSLAQRVEKLTRAVEAGAKPRRAARKTTRKSTARGASSRKTAGRKTTARRAPKPRATA